MKLAAVVLVALAIGAASPSTRAQAGDPAQGAVIASQGAPGVAACAGCHGAQGEGQAAAGFPRLDGQSAAYLQRQLEAYAGGWRTNPIMEPIAKAMTPAQRAAAAAHYGNLAGAAPPRAATSASAPSPIARTLATVGAQDRNLQGCANCHGPDGIGEWATYPALAGQHASYLKNALAEWKDGTRRTDPSEQMPRIARLLSAAETDALVAYYASLPPPARVGARQDAASAPAGARTVVSGPASGSGGGSPQGAGATQGLGTEQGAPVSGGTQGVGGPGNPTGPRSGAPTGATGTASSSPARQR
jgi:cytochrome c553